MGLFDYGLNQFDPNQGGLFGAHDLAALLQAYGGFRKPPNESGAEPSAVWNQPWAGLPRADAPQIPMDPSGSAPMGAAQPNPYGNPAGVMPTFSTTASTEGQPQPQQAGGPWIKPNSFLDKLFGQPNIANAAPAPQMPSMSGAEPNAAWTGPQNAQPPQMAPGFRPGAFGPPPQAQGPGAPLSILPQNVNAMPDNSAPANPPQGQVAMAQGTLPQAQPAQGQRQGFNPLRSVGGFLSSLDPANRPVFGTIGHDIAGNPQYGWIDSANQKVTPLDAGAGIGYPKGPDGQPLQGQELLGHLKKTDPTAASMVDAIIRGDASVTGKNLQKYMPIATLVDPNLQQFNYDSRKKAALAFAPGGKEALNVKSLETIGGHLEKMYENFDKLGNTWSPEFNSLKNWFAVRGGHGELNAFETNANGVANELGTVFRSAGMSDAEVKSWRDRILASGSPEQFNKGMSALLDMLKTRKEAIAEQYRSGMGKDLPPERFQKLDSAIAAIEKRQQLPTGAAPSGSAGWSVKKL